MEEKKAAGKTDWETCEMPERHAEYSIQRHFSKNEMECLRFGHIPAGMEDKWFWYMEGQKLYAYRSWTGYCIYILTFQEDSDMIHVIANRDPEQYGCSDDKEDVDFLNDLLDWWTQANYDYYHEWLSEVLASQK